MKGILFHNSFHVPATRFAGYTTCWLPLIPDINEVIGYYHFQINGQTPIILEEKFRSFFGREVPDYVSFVEIAPKTTRFNRKLCLYAQSDTLAHSCSKIVPELERMGVEVRLIVPVTNDEGAARFFTEKQLPYQTFSLGVLKQFKPDLFVVLNDWTKEVHRIFAHCHRLKVPTICVQESIIDFGDHIRRMQFADAVIIQGVHTIKELKREHYFITGNPRYDFDRKNVPGNTALINSNFTYGIFEEVRDQWLGDIQTVLVRNEVDYLISQHPRDKGEIEKYGKVAKSNSQLLPGMIRSSGFVITRFSSIVHEALAFNVPVIYYNPHGEKMQYDFGYNDTFLRYATTVDELERAVIYLKQGTTCQNDIARYLSQHCLLSADACHSIAEALSGAQVRPRQMRIGDYVRMVMYYPPLLDFIKKIKRVLKR